MTPPPDRPPRLAVRAILLRRNRLLVVNAWPGSDRLWCAPGGGIEAHVSLADNLRREVHEETGLTVAVGAPCLVNEFHDPAGEFHQVDLYFRCRILAGDPEGDWTDPEGIVSFRRWVTREELRGLPHKPDMLARAAWGEAAAFHDPLEPIIR